MKSRLIYLSSLLVMAVLVTASTACDKNGNINVLSLEQDKQLGAQTARQIDSLSGEYPQLDRTQYAASYAYLEAMKNQILASGEVTYATDFVWQMRIIRDDNTLNAFCTPGGYIYVYSGLIKFLDRADDLAGVIGHEMGHADLRHTSRQMTQTYGYDLVLQVALGQNAGALTNLALQLKDLAYSRGYETEADNASVKYLAKTSYACDGAKSFFQKLIDQDQAGSTPEFLSTHPNPSNRVSNITEQQQKLNCSTSGISESGMSYAQFKSSLP